MTNNNNTVSVTYTDAELRNLIEEYITQQKSDITLKGVCSYILYRAMEEERTANRGLYGTNQLSQADCGRVSSLLKKIIGENRLTAASGYGEAFADEAVFAEVKE